jgi:hypothetical protein
VNISQCHHSEIHVHDGDKSICFEDFRCPDANGEICYCIPVSDEEVELKNKKGEIVIMIKNKEQIKLLIQSEIKTLEYEFEQMEQLGNSYFLAHICHTLGVIKRLIKSFDEKDDASEVLSDLNYQETYNKYNEIIIKRIAAYCTIEKNIIELFDKYNKIIKENIKGE